MTTRARCPKVLGLDRRRITQVYCVAIYFRGVHNGQQRAVVKHAAAGRRGFTFGFSTGINLAAGGCGGGGGGDRLT